MSLLSFYTPPTLSPNQLFNYFVPSLPNHHCNELLKRYEVIGQYAHKTQIAQNIKVPIFVPTVNRRKYTIFDYRSDVYACIDAPEHNLYEDISQDHVLEFPACNIQQKRNLIQKHCKEQGLIEILMIDDDVIVSEAQLQELVKFCREHGLAFGSFSDKTRLNQPFRTTPILYLRIDMVPDFRTDEVFEDLCLEFQCLKQYVPVGCLKGSVKYFYEMNESSVIMNRQERMKNTCELYPEYTEYIETGFKLLENEN